MLSSRLLRTPGIAQAVLSRTCFAAMAMEEVPVVADSQAPASTEPRAEWPWKKAKKAAVMLSFCGKNYTGMQRNPGFPTIEEELLKALDAAGAIAPEWKDSPQKAFFQRASRTDKGVSAVKMIVSLKLLHNSDTIDQMNAVLPFDVRVQSIKRVTKNFNSKQNCDARTYLYLLPTFAFSPVEAIVTEEYRIDEDKRAAVNKVLSNYLGTHYFHNYTSGKVPLEPSSRRYINTFEMGAPFVRDGLELAIIRVKGQSFMLHQIRKMIGMAIAVVRGHVSPSLMDEAWKEDKVDIPRAPGLGLMLEEVHYEKYNKKFGKDGVHEALTWEEVSESVEKFKEDYIIADIISTEKKEGSMLEWVSKLPMHTFDRRHFEDKEGSNSPVRKALLQIARSKRPAAAADDDDDELECGGDDDELECGGDDDEDDEEREAKRSRVEKNNL